MTIDEAIAHAREVAETCECEASRYDMCDSYERQVAYKEGKCGEEHKQLAEWLEELKAIKDGSIPIIHGNAELEFHDKKVYNKAIDDFVKFASDMPTVKAEDGTIRPMWLEEIAKELKEQNQNTNIKT